MPECDEIFGFTNMSQKRAGNLSWNKDISTKLMVGQTSEAFCVYVLFNAKGVFSF